MRAAAWLTSSLAGPGLWAVRTCAANRSSMDECTSGGNGILQIEQRVAPWYSIKWGGRFALGTVEPLAHGFLFCLYLAPFCVNFLDFAGTIFRGLHHLVDFLERVHVRFVWHASSLRRSAGRARAEIFKLHRYPPPGQCIRSYGRTRFLAT